MKSQRWRFFWIVFATVAALLSLWPPHEKFKPGIDLSGGTILVYQINPKSAPRGFKMEDMITAIKRRVNPQGVADYQIRPIGNWRLELVMPRATPQEVDSVKERVSTVGQLEFRILANERRHRALVDEARRLLKTGEAIPGRPIKAGDHVGEWVKIDKIPDPNNPGALIDAVYSSGRDKTVTMVYPPKDPDAKEPDDRKIQRWSYALGLVPSKGKDVTGEFLEYAEPSVDQHQQPAVGFTFDNVGAYRFGNLTWDYKPEQDGFKHRLAIVLDKTMKSAPSLDSPIDKHGIISTSGGFRKRDLDNLIAVLNAGKLPAALNKQPISEQTMGPAIGTLTIRRGKIAMIVSMCAVVVFLMVYYRLAGLLATLALLLNMVLILGAMAFVEATFTLPGLAGLVLTIGMAVDANVLIFERTREELDHGASLKMAIRNGYSRAFRTIFDANLTTIITAIILYNIGTEEVKGFAIVLIIGIIMSMFAGVFATHTVFNALIGQRWLRQLSMMRLVRNPSVRFTRYRHIAFTGSVLLLLVGLATFVFRGRENLDIDFTGGTLVAMKCSTVQDVAEVRRRAQKAGLKDITVTTYAFSKEDEGLRFRLTTSDDRQARVAAAVKANFDDILPHQQMSWQPPTLIAATTQPASTQPAATQPASPFTGGYRVVLAFTPPAMPSSVSTKINDTLRAQKLEYPENFYRVQGLKSAAESTEKFDTMVLETKPGLALPPLLAQLKKALAEEVVFDRVNNFGAAVAAETQLKAIVAILYSLAAIVVYIWFRFGNVAWGLAAILALAHDVLISLGLVALSQYLAGPLGFLMIEPFKIDLAMVGAFLTIIGYSLNDTIVVFDRLREVRGKAPVITAEMVDTTINQTLSRTLLTSLTTFMVVAILYVWGGPGIHAFAFCMAIGVLVGTYSSIYIASPILIGLGKKKPAGRQAPSTAAATS